MNAKFKSQIDNAIKEFDKLNAEQVCRLIFATAIKCGLNIEEVTTLPEKQSTKKTVSKKSPAKQNSNTQKYNKEVLKKLPNNVKKPIKKVIVCAKKNTIKKVSKKSNW